MAVFYGGAQFTGSISTTASLGSDTAPIAELHAQKVCATDSLQLGSSGSPGAVRWVTNKGPDGVWRVEIDITVSDGSWRTMQTWWVRE